MSSSVGMKVSLLSRDVYSVIVTAGLIFMVYLFKVQNDQFSKMNLLMNSKDQQIQTLTAIQTFVASTTFPSSMVTAYTLGKGASGTHFASGVPVAAAVSPSAETKHKLGDSILLVDKKNPSYIIPAKIVDRTAQTESREVIDILFKNNEDAINFGRKRFAVVNAKHLFHITKK